MANMKSQIALAIQNVIESIPEIKSFSFIQIKLATSDFNEEDLPACQLIDAGLTSVHEMKRAKKTWALSLELVLKSDDPETVNQTTLWELEQIILRALWVKPNLGVRGLINLVYLGSVTDLHLLQPYHVLRLDFEAVFYETLVGDC